MLAIESNDTLIGLKDTGRTRIRDNYKLSAVLKTILYG